MYTIISKHNQLFEKATTEKLNETVLFIRYVPVYNKTLKVLRVSLLQTRTRANTKSTQISALVANVFYVKNKK